jgi:hypothetical protein
MRTYLEPIPHYQLVNLQELKEYTNNTKVWAQHLDQNIQITLV